MSPDQCGHQRFTSSRARERAIHAVDDQGDAEPEEAFDEVVLGGCDERQKREERTRRGEDMNAEGPKRVFSKLRTSTVLPCDLMRRSPVVSNLVAFVAIADNCLACAIHFLAQGGKGSCLPNCRRPFLNACRPPYFSTCKVNWRRCHARKFRDDRRRRRPCRQCGGAGPRVVRLRCRGSRAQAGTRRMAHHGAAVRVPSHSCKSLGVWDDDRAARRAALDDAHHRCDRPAAARAGTRLPRVARSALTPSATMSPIPVLLRRTRQPHATSTGHVTFIEGAVEGATFGDGLQQVTLGRRLAADGESRRRGGWHATRRSAGSAVQASASGRIRKRRLFSNFVHTLPAPRCQHRIPHCRGAVHLRSARAEPVRPGLGAAARKGRGPDELAHRSSSNARSSGRWVPCWAGSPSRRRSRRGSCRVSSRRPSAGRAGRSPAKRRMSFPPIGAQGFNLGIRDVELIAAWRAGSIYAPCGAGSALSIRRRFADVTSRTVSVDILNRSLLSGFLPIQLARIAGMHAINMVGPLRRLLMREGVAARWPDEVVGRRVQADWLTLSP